MPLVASTIPGIGLSRNVQIMVTNLQNLHFSIIIVEEKTYVKIMISLTFSL